MWNTHTYWYQNTSKMRACSLTTSKCNQNANMFTQTDFNNSSEPERFQNVSAFYNTSWLYTKLCSADSMRVNGAMRIRCVSCSAWRAPQRAVVLRANIDMWCRLLHVLIDTTMILPHSPSWWNLGKCRVVICGKCRVVLRANIDVQCKLLKVQDWSADEQLPCVFQLK